MTFDDFVLQNTGRDMEYHNMAGTIGLIFAREAFEAAKQSEREACANLLRRNANAEKDQAKREAFIEAHNAILSRSNAKVTGA